MAERRRRRDEVFEGMKIEHRWRRESPNDASFDWFCTILEILEDQNELKVLVTGKYGSHPETWNMAHTVSGLTQREYIEIKEENG